MKHGGHWNAWIKCSQAFVEENVSRVFAANALQDMPRNSHCTQCLFAYLQIHGGLVFPVCKTEQVDSIITSARNQLFISRHFKTVNAHAHKGRLYRRRTNYLTQSYETRVLQLVISAKQRSMLFDLRFARKNGRDIVNSHFVRNWSCATAI